MTSAAHAEDTRDPRTVDEVLLHQDGVITRRQAQACGDHVWDIRRRLRRRDWVRLLPGVYVDHTGEPSWKQRAWAGVLYLAPAALAGHAAIRAGVGASWRRLDAESPIEIAIAPERNIVVPSGYLRRRPVHFRDSVQWNTSPPRVNLEDATLDVVAREPDEFAAVGVLADVCQTRRTTANRIRSALDGRRRLRRRVWLGDVLGDIANGTCSVLEHGYLTRVERAHSLPAGQRQTPRASDRGAEFRDVTYPGLEMEVELDGRLFHDNSRQRDLDLDRDLDAVVEGRLTVRLGWGQVFDRPCRTAGRLASLMLVRGWDGVPRRCGPECTMPDPEAQPTA
ncbi:MAG TPA: hypothetical protein VFI40_11265 [Nocardioides sp.]|nr:hypothetical protein [Nocardioides sp.]